MPVFLESLMCFFIYSLVPILKRDTIRENHCSFGLPYFDVHNPATPLLIRVLSVGFAAPLL